VNIQGGDDVGGGGGGGAAPIWEKNHTPPLLGGFFGRGPLAKKE